MILSWILGWYRFSKVRDIVRIWLKEIVDLQSNVRLDEQLADSPTAKRWLAVPPSELPHCDELPQRLIDRYINQSSMLIAFSTSDLGHVPYILASLVSRLPLREAGDIRYERWEDDETDGGESTNADTVVRSYFVQPDVSHVPDHFDIDRVMTTLRPHVAALKRIDPWNPSTSLYTVLRWVYDAGLPWMPKPPEGDDIIPF